MRFALPFRACYGRLGQSAALHLQPNPTRRCEGMPQPRHLIITDRLATLSSWKGQDARSLGVHNLSRNRAVLTESVTCLLCFCQGQEL